MNSSIAADQNIAHLASAKLRKRMQEERSSETGKAEQPSKAAAGRPAAGIAAKLSSRQQQPEHQQAEEPKEKHQGSGTELK